MQVSVRCAHPAYQEAARLGVTSPAKGGAMSERYEWDGNVLSTTCMALSVHTSIAEAPSVVPELVFAAADSGVGACILAPRQLGAFLQAHSACHLVCYDAARVHWVLHQLFRSQSNTA